MVALEIQEAEVSESIVMRSNQTCFCLSMARPLLFLLRRVQLSSSTTIETITHILAGPQPKREQATKKRCSTCVLMGEATKLVSHYDATVRAVAVMWDLFTSPASLNMQQPRVSRLMGNES